MLTIPEIKTISGYETQEIFTLEKLLSYTKIQLNLLVLTKVYNPNLKEWYIKTLPNKILIDNLE